MLTITTLQHRRHHHQPEKNLRPHSTFTCTFIFLSVEQSSPLSLVKTFDSVIAVYEGFCHLKQVDLKLKVCRGSSVRKILIREAKAYESAILVVGTSKCRHTIRSPVSVAKHCSRKLPRNFSVFAVDNGKIVFHRTATPSPSANSGEKSCATDSPRSRHLLAGDSGEPTTEVKSVLGRRSTSSAGVGRRSAVIKRYLGCGNPSSWAGYSCDIEEEDAIGSISLMDSVALVPYQVPKGSSEPRYVVNHNLGDEKKQGWALLRRVFQSKQHHRLCKVGSCRLVTSMRDIIPSVWLVTEVWLRKCGLFGQH